MLEYNLRLSGFSHARLMGEYPADEISKIGKQLNLTGWFWTSPENLPLIRPTDSTLCYVIEPNAEKYGRYVRYSAVNCTLGESSTYALIGTVCERSKLTTCEWSVKSKSSKLSKNIGYFLHEYHVVIVFKIHPYRIKRIRNLKACVSIVYIFCVDFELILFSMRYLETLEEEEKAWKRHLDCKNDGKRKKTATYSGTYSFINKLIFKNA